MNQTKSIQKIEYLNWIRFKDLQCLVLREIDFQLKFFDLFLACFTCGVTLHEVIDT